MKHKTRIALALFFGLLPFQERPEILLCSMLGPAAAPSVESSHCSAMDSTPEAAPACCCAEHAESPAMPGCCFRLPERSTDTALPQLPSPDRFEAHHELLVDRAAEEAPSAVSRVESLETRSRSSPIPAFLRNVSFLC